MSNDLLTVKELAARIKVQPGTIYKWVREEVIPVVRLGSGKRSAIRFRPEEVEAWINKQ